MGTRPRYIAGLQIAKINFSKSIIRPLRYFSALYNTIITPSATQAPRHVRIMIYCSAILYRHEGASIVVERNRANNNNTATTSHKPPVEEGNAGSTTLTRLSSGIPGLDEILHGGFIARQAYLIRGGPGSGKTTLGLHMLTAGAMHGEKALFITLSESEEQIRKNAAPVGLSLEGVDFLDLSPNADGFTALESYDIFSPSEVEREPITQKIIERVQQLQPERVFLDAMTQFRYLSPDAFQFRKQVLAFLRFLGEQGATTLFSSEGTEAAPDDDLQFMSDGILNLAFAKEERTISVSKFRGSAFRNGQHSMRLTETGMKVYPRLLPESYKTVFVPETISSGIPEIDELLHGGLERGTITILTGPSGVGKTTLGLQFMKEAAGRGERSVVYLFDEQKEILLQRCENINIPVHAMMKRGTLSIEQIEPLHFTPDEFAMLVRSNVETYKASIVMIDSTAGYRLSLQGEDLVSHLHALSKYLQNLGVAVLLINEVEAITGEFHATENGISYMADNLIFMRYLELHGEIHKAIGVLKKRLTDFEKTMREIEITRYGVKVGSPLVNLRGILTGVPELQDESLGKF
jgi:circadian clock protein KaiC